MALKFISSFDYANYLHPESWKDWPNWHIIERQAQQWTPITGSWVTATGATSVYYSSYGSSWAYGEYDVEKKNKKLEFSFSTEVQTGWRAWSIVDFHRRGNSVEKRLQALGTKPIWEPYQPNVATCVTDGTHEAPWPTCRCGFWAFKDRKHVEQALFSNYGGEKGKVIGQIALWGRVLETTRGYRGEYAYPQTLQFVEVKDEIAAEVAALYGVPYSIVQRSESLKCEGQIIATEYDYDRLYATIKYTCGLEVRVEINRNFEGKMNWQLKEPPPCPDHHP